MSPLKLLVLGSPRLERAGVPLELDTRKAMALLIYLAMTDQSHSRETLATLFWPEYDPTRARTYLRRALWMLKKAVGETRLMVERQSVGLKSGTDLWLDVTHFRQLLASCEQHNHSINAVCADCLSPLTEAVDLYQGDFLAGFTLPDCPEFDDWQFFQTESLRRELASVLERLIQGHSAQGEYEAAIPHARRWLAIDPLHEPAQRQLIQLYAQAGQQAAALRQYEEYVKLLAEELGIPPEEETTTLYEAIKAKRILGPYLKAEEPFDVAKDKQGGRGTRGKVDQTTAADLVEALTGLAEGKAIESRRPDSQTILTLAAQQRDAGDYAAAIDLLKSLLTHNPADERIHRELMHLYALAGHRHEALRQYQLCIETLATELGMSPDPETEALYQQIIGVEMAPPPTSTPKPAWLPPAPIAVEVERSAPLVGREQELETVQAKIGTGWHGHGGTILLAGVSGLGKTRLAYEALRNAAQSGVTTLVGAAYEQEGHLPYHPFIEAFDRYLAEQQRSPEQNPITYYKPMGASDLQKENSALFKATASFLTSLTTDGPVILLLDDLHAADEASLSLFHYLARQTRSSPIILLATYRTDIALNGVSPFGSLLNALYRERLSEVLHLTPLPEAVAATIVNHTLEAEAEPALIKTIFEVAEGNPFYIQEITRAMLKADHLVQEEGQWHLQPGTTLQVPAGLQELLRERVQRLGPTVESTLTAGAVVGREFRFVVLRSVTGLPDGDLFDALDAALSGHLLEETDEGYRFQHSLIRHTLYEALSRRRRAWLHTRAAEAIEATYAQRPEGLMPHIEALAFHYDLSDRRDKALSYLRQAAQKAAAVFALEVANDYLERALALMDELGVDDAARRWPILEQLGMLAKVLADTTRAVSCYEQALALPPTDEWQPGPSDRVRLHRSAARTLITAGRAVEAEQHLQTAMEIMADTGQASLDYANLLYDVALWHWHNNEHQEAFEAAQRSLAIAERLDDVTARAQAYEMLALACHSLGEWQQGLNFEQQRSTLIGPNLDVTEAFDAHL